MLEKGIGSIWIEGEISNFSKPASGHWYFSLKDETAQLRAAMFKNKNNRVSFTPENGQKVLIRAQVTLYQARGEFQVVVEHMEEAGAGLLMRQFEALKQQLSNEGLFSNEQKKAVPTQARHIGIITSATGAAIRDALSVIKRRAPSTEVTVFPTAVQGESATPQIIKAIESANRYKKCDVLLLIRGGGSIEDLWCFNEESVVRAVFASNIPLVSGIGHEVDFTITDFVADKRAPTPSVAAETVTTDQYELMSHIDLMSARLMREMSHKLTMNQQKMVKLNERLVAFHPRHQMKNLKLRLIHAQSKLNSQARNLVTTRQQQLRLSIEAIRHSNPVRLIQLYAKQIENYSHQNTVSMKAQVTQSKHQLALQARSLDNLSPLKTLSRGFAVVSKKKQTISSVKQLTTDDDIEIHFKDGNRQARVL